MVKTYQPPNMSANVTAYFFDQNHRHLGVHIGLERRQMQEQICRSHYHQLGADNACTCGSAFTTLWYTNGRWLKHFTVITS